LRTYRAMLCITRIMPSQDVRLSVCRVSHVGILAKRLNISSNFFSPSSNHTILVFPYQTASQQYDGDPHNQCVECKGMKQEAQLSQRDRATLRALNILLSHSTSLKVIRNDTVEYYYYYYYYYYFFFIIIIIIIVKIYYYFFLLL